MKIFVSAGEVSGDFILGRILAGLRGRFPGLELCGLGGAAAERQGLRPLFPLERTAVSGLGDVLRAAFFALSMRRAALRALEESRADLALLVDYPGLNLTLARRARELGVPVYYVAPPQAWAYRAPERKLRKAARALEGETVHVLFPFEAEAYGFARKVVSGHFLARGQGSETGARGDLLCLCPGSRLPVLRRNLPAWLRALDEAGVLRAAGPISILVPAHLENEARALSEGWRARYRSMEVTSDKDRVLRDARWAFAFPGTVTLELAMHGIPTAGAALLDPLTLAAGRRVLRETRVLLPNLLLGEGIFPEWVGVPGRFGAAEAAGLWAALREKAWNWKDLQGGLDRVLGPGDGAGKAIEQCGGILEKIVTL